MRAALLCLLLSTPALAEDADCAAFRAGRPFEIRFEGRAAQRSYVMTEQYTQNADGSSIRLWRVDEGRVSRSFGRNGFTTLTESGPDRTWLTYQGVDLSADPYAGDAPFDFSTQIRAPNGITSDLRSRAVPTGTDTVALGGCSFAVRHWTVESHPASRPAEITRMRYVYAPELRVSIERVGSGTQSFEIVAREIATRFTPLQ